MLHYSLHKYIFLYNFAGVDRNSEPSLTVTPNNGSVKVSIGSSQPMTVPGAAPEGELNTTMTIQVEAITGTNAPVTISATDPADDQTRTWQVIPVNNVVADKELELQQNIPATDPWSVEESKTIDVKIISGNGGYTFSGFQADELKVTHRHDNATHLSSEADYVVIEGLKVGGPYTITVEDSKGKTATLQVTVTAPAGSGISEEGWTIATNGDVTAITDEAITKLGGKLVVPDRGLVLTNSSTLLNGRDGITALDLNNVTEISAMAILNAHNLEKVIMRKVNKLSMYSLANVAALKVLEMHMEDVSAALFAKNTLKLPATVEIKVPSALVQKYKEALKVNYPDLESKVTAL